jgi:hypothetical protein
MDMTGSGSAFTVVPEHVPGLVALVAVPIVVGLATPWVRARARRDVAWARALTTRVDRLSFAARVALLGTLIGAVVHLALVPTHWTPDRLDALLFLVDAAGFGIAFFWTLFERRRANLVAAAMLVGTAAAYAWYVLSGRETADLVGLLTTTIELAAGLIVVSAIFAPLATAGRAADRTVAATLVSIAAMLGTTALATASSGTAAADAVSGSLAPASMPGMSRSGSAPLSLATASPAGPITWPADMSTMSPGMKMATGNCTARPTAAQQRAAVDLVDQTVAAVAPYSSLAAAKAAGYVPVTPSGLRVVHYINPAIYRQGATVDPHHIPVLVYVNTTHGAVLSAAMYLLPESAAADPPQPGGCLTQWHIHTDLCLNGGGVVGTNEGGSCPAGSINRATTPMMHVWVTPVSGGPLSPDPSTRNEVAAANVIPAPNPPNGTA